MIVPINDVNVYVSCISIHIIVDSGNYILGSNMNQIPAYYIAQRELFYVNVTVTRLHSNIPSISSYIEGSGMSGISSSS